MHSTTYVFRVKRVGFLHLADTNACFCNTGRYCDTKLRCTWRQIRCLSISPSICFSIVSKWGTAAAAPQPFSPGNPALCGSRPLVTTYYCRLEDLLCFCSCLLIVCLICLCTICSFSTLMLLVGSFDL